MYNYINHVYHVSLPYKTEMAKFQRKVAPPLLIIVLVLTEEIVPIYNYLHAFFIYFFYKLVTWLVFKIKLSVWQPVKELFLTCGFFSWL